MRRTVFLAAGTLVCMLGVNAQQHNIDTQKSTLTIHVGKTGVFSGLGHEHEVRAAIHSGMADTGSHPDRHLLELATPGTWSVYQEEFVHAAAKSANRATRSSPAPHVALLLAQGEFALLPR